MPPFTWLAFVLGVLLPALVVGSVPTWVSTTCAPPEPHPFGYTTFYATCPYDNFTFVSTLPFENPSCSNVTIETEALCWSTRYNGGFKKDLFRTDVNIKTTSGVPYPSIITDGDASTVMCLSELDQIAPASVQYVIEPKDASVALAFVSYVAFANATSAFSLSGRLFTHPQGTLVSSVQPDLESKKNAFDFPIPNPQPGQKYLLQANYGYTLYSYPYISCMGEIYAFRNIPDDEPGLGCPCTEDGTYGSYCAKHAITDDQPWCYTTCQNTGLFSDRTGRYFKHCGDYEIESSCESPVLVNSNPFGLYYGLAKNLKDSSRLPDDCGFAVQGTKGFWYKALGDDKNITISTCPENQKPLFSATASVFVAQGEVVCDSLTCLGSSVFTKKERFTCGDKIATNLEFFGRKSVWYYIWIGPDGAPNFFYSPDEALLGNLFQVSIRGAASYNAPVQKTIYDVDSSDTVFLPNIYSPENYEIVNGACRNGYYLNSTRNIACGSLDPNCEPIIYSCIDIDECADQQLNNCHRYATCTNIPGSFTCKCADTFSGDGIEQCKRKSVFELNEMNGQKTAAIAIEKLSYLLEQKYGFNSAIKSKAAIEETDFYIESAIEKDLGAWMGLLFVRDQSLKALGDEIPTTESFPNIGFLGRGYDVFLGNPLSTLGVDPGYRLGVFKFSFSTGSSTDGTFSIPKLVTATREPYSSFDSTSRVITTESEYQSSATDSFDLSVNAGGEYDGAFKITADVSFQLNKEHEQTLETISKSESVFVQIVGKTVVYRARLEDKTPADLTPAFIKYVESLDPSCEYETGTFTPKCSAEEEQKYQQIIELFGTHYTTEVTMGGRAFDRYTLSVNEMQSIQTKVSASSMGLSVNAALEYSSFSGFVKTQGQITSKLSSSARNLLKTEGSKRNQWFQGGSAGMGDGVTASLEALKNWAASVPSNPVPVAVSFMPLPAVLTSKQFPNDPAIKRKQRHLFEVLFNVCNRKGGDNCAQFLNRLDVKEDDPDLIRFGDFIEISSLSYPGLAEGVTAQLIQGSSTYDASTNSNYFPILLSQIAHDAVTNEATIVSGGAVVRSYQLVSSTDTCYCDISKLKANLKISFHVQESSHTDATMSLYVSFKNEQNNAITESFFFNFNNGQLETDNTRTYQSDFFSVSLGSVIDSIRLVIKTGDQVILDQFSAEWIGRTFSFSNQIDTSSGGTFILTSFAPSGTLINLCSSLESYFQGDATGPTECQTSCQNLAIPTAGSKICTNYAFFTSPNRCVLSDDTSRLFEPISPDQIQGKTLLSCSGFPAPATLPARYVSTSAGRYTFIDSATASLVKFQILSPISIYNEARRIVRYGDTAILASSGGGVSFRTASSSFLSSEPMVSVVDNKLSYKDATSLNFVYFRLLSTDIAQGQPLRQTDDSLIFEIKTGYYSLLFNQPQVILLGIDAANNVLKPVPMRNVNDYEDAKFKITRIPVNRMAPSSEQFGDFLIHPQMTIQVERIENTWLWLNISLPSDIKGPGGRNVLYTDFSAVLSNYPSGAGQVLVTSVTPFQSTAGERSRNMFNLRFDFGSTNVVPNKQITVILDPKIKSVGDFPKPVDPKTVQIIDDRPDVAVGRFIFVDDLKTTTLQGQIFFKTHIVTDDDLELQSTSEDPVNGRYAIIDGNGKTVTCSTQWDSPSGRVMSISCNGIPSDQADKIVFRLFFPCTLQFVLPSGASENYCKDYTKAQEDFPLIPFIKTVPIPSAKAVRVLFGDSFASSDGTTISAPQASDFAVTGSFNKIILNSCSVASTCAPGISSLDISGVSASTRFALVDPCSKMLWTRSTYVFNRLCVENGPQSTFLAQSFKIYDI